MQSRVKDYKNIHKGETGFAIGAGWSLKDLTEDQIEILKRNPTITVNSGIRKSPWANYYLADDWAVWAWDYFHEDVSNFEGTCFFYKKKLKKYVKHLDRSKIVWFDHTDWREGDLSTVKMTSDEPIIGARTALASAVHILHIMGCDPIVLLGADCCLSETGKRYFWQYPEERSCKKVKKVCIAGSKPKARKRGFKLDNHSQDFLSYWEDFANANQDINIINASPGVLDSFEKKNLNQILK